LCSIGFSHSNNLCGALFLGEETMRKKWTNKEIICLIKFKNISAQKLQKYFPDRTVSAIYGMRKKLNITKKQYVWSKKEVTFITKNYPNIGAMGCSQKFNLPKGLFISYASRHGIKAKLKVKGYISKLRNIAKRKIRDLAAHNLTIKTQEQSYTLGFLWGDGHLYKAGPAYGRYYAKIEIIKEDYLDIGKIFQCFGKWSEKSRQKTGCKITTCATLFDNVLGAFLKLNDYDKKSVVSPSKILKVIPVVLHKYFWRGFIDAEGCFGWNKNYGYFQITGSYDQKWSNFENVLKNLNIKYTLAKLSYYDNRTSRISIYSKPDIATLGKFIYADKQNLCLKRKYKKFLNITR
jgi:hypothetical protein